MDRIARVSAVFLLILGMFVCRVWSGQSDHQGVSPPRLASRSHAGVGTKPAVGVQESTGGDEEYGGGPKVGPLTVFRGVEMGWRNGTPKSFERYLGKGKVRLDFGEGGPRGGLYSRSQAYYLIADYLRRAQTVSIGLVRISEAPGKGARPYALLERMSRYRNGLSRKEMIFVSLLAEDGQWVISEMRAVPAK